MKAWVSPFAVPNETRPRFSRFPFTFPVSFPVSDPVSFVSFVSPFPPLPRRPRPAATSTPDNGHRTERTGLEQGLNTTGMVPKKEVTSEISYSGTTNAIRMRYKRPTTLREFPR